MVTHLNVMIWCIESDMDVEQIQRLDQIHELLTKQERQHGEPRDLMQ